MFVSAIFLNSSDESVSFFLVIDSEIIREESGPIGPFRRDFVG